VSDASLYITMTPKRERERDHLLVMADIRRVMLEAAPEARRLGVNEMSWVSGGGFSSYPIEYTVQGPELAELERVSEEILSGVRASSLFVDPKSTWETGKPEVQVLVNRRRVADLGVPVRELASTVRALVGGVDVASYEEAGSRYDVRLRLEEDQRDDLDKLGRIQVRSVGGQLIDLSNLATLRIARAPARIDRQDRVRKISLFSNTPAGVALGTATDEFDRIVASVNLAPGYVGNYRGMAERMKDTADAIFIAFVFALVALYMILGSQFNSFVQPGVIMLTAPLAFVGAFAALALTGSEMSMFAQIGLIALMGLVMKNGILLVDCANQRRAEGLDARTAVLRAGPMRLRPVLMTAFSTIFGMLPVAVSQSDGSEWRSPMGIIVIGGLLSSTFLTLLVVPVAYTLVDDVLEMLRRLSRRSGAARTRLRRRVRVNGRRAA
jgi:HAE1 family hydrophobic/amphiphilic exporter-1